MIATRPSSAITGSPSRVRRYEPPSSMRSRKRRYSVKQPSPMCWPLSGGGSGSPSRSGSVCTAPPSVGRASKSVTAWPASTRSSAAASPARPPPTTATFTAAALRHDRELARRGEPRLLAEDVEAAGLDPVERLPVQPGKRPDAERAAAVERVQQTQPLGEVRPRPLRLERHQFPKLRRRSELLDLERGELVLWEVDAAELPILADVADYVDQLERDAERHRMLCVVRAVHGNAGEPDGACDLLAVAAQLGEVGVGRLLGVLQAAVDERLERLARDAEALARVAQRHEHRIRGIFLQCRAKLLELGPLLLQGQ